MADPPNISCQEVKDIQTRLLRWFEQNRRVYPWRETNDPFAILVAEKLLQQTSARTLVVDAFLELIWRYPNPAALAQANVDEVRGLIHSLGFHYRAKELIDLAQALVDVHWGVVPNGMVQLLKLPGVGEYTARAVASFAFGQDIPIVDTNVARVFQRVFALPDAVLKNPAGRKDLLVLATMLLPKGKARDFNFAILDLSALVCTKTKPKCPICPIQPHCEFGKVVAAQTYDL